MVTAGGQIGELVPAGSIRVCQMDLLAIHFRDFDLSAGHRLAALVGDVPVELRDGYLLRPHKGRKETHTCEGQQTG